MEDKVCPYKVLGIRKKSSAEKVKKAFRKLAKELHPDVNNGNHSERLLKVTEAYKYLSNPELKKHYDETGILKDLKEEYMIVEAAKNNLANLLRSILQHEQFISNPKGVNLIETLNNVIQQNLDNFLRNRIKVTSSISALEEANNRFHSSKEERFLCDVISSMVQEKQREKDKIERDIQISSRMKSLLEDYSYDFEVVNIMQRVIYTTGTYSTSTY